MATLVHDDVLDEAEVRRRGQTINAQAGNDHLPQFVVASGPSKRTMQKQKAAGTRHLRTAINFYRRQMAGGRFFLHEHPWGASSWEDEEMVKLGWAGALTLALFVLTLNIVGRYLVRKKH